MWRLPTWAVLGLLLVAVAWPVPHALAQLGDEPAQQQKAAEFLQLWERLDQTQGAEERIALADRALQLEPELDRWPMAMPRDEVRANLWWRRGSASLQWSGGDAADNIEQAIAAYERALQFFTQTKSAANWAALQISVGDAYSDRTLGDLADNAEKAISAYQAALFVRTREAMPREWADTQIRLGNAYAGRIMGDLADSMEKSIGALQAALTVITREALPSEWAVTQNNLGETYRGRILGDRADNMEKAIGAYQAALTEITREALPHRWAGIQSNLGSAYGRRILGSRADNLEKAIGAYQAALAVTTSEARPREWAGYQSNLGVVYIDRILGDRADNLEKAISASQSALTVYTRTAEPRDWAGTQTNLGLAYFERSRIGHFDTLEMAIAAYEAALTVGTREAPPRSHLRTSLLLGQALLQARDWRKAGLAYASARDAFLLMFGQGLNEAEARDLIDQSGSLFAEASYAAAQRGEGEAALALASEGRARLMAVALKLGRDDRPRVAQLRTAIRLGERAMAATQGAERAAAVDGLANLRQELLALVKDADLDGRSAVSALAQAYALAAEGGVVVVPIVTRVGSKILIATSDPPSLTIHDLPDLTTDRLDVLVRGDGKAHGWLAAYKINYLSGSEFESRWPEWLTAVSEMGPQLWRLFGGRLDEVLKERGIKTAPRLVWLPTGALGIFPLGLAQNPASKRYLADDYQIVYAPSLGALASAQKQIAKPAPATLAVVINPTGDLPGTEKEGQLVASYFPGKARTSLQREKATPDAVLAALKGKTHWHFASHGTFSWNDARQSALVMYGHAQLSVGRLLDTDGLGHPRLVVLSACETGLYDITRNPDEFIGLPGTFTTLGAAGVLGTLWPVNDLATPLLIAKFYELHMGQGLAPPAALSKAQIWMRQATNGDLQAYARAAAKQGRLQSRHLQEIEQELSEDGLRRSRNNAHIEWTTDAVRSPGTKANAPSASHSARPYAHPYFWAGFIYTGL